MLKLSYLLYFFTSLPNVPAMLRQAVDSTFLVTLSGWERCKY